MEETYNEPRHVSGFEKSKEFLENLDSIVNWDLFDESPKNDKERMATLRILAIVRFEIDTGWLI
jgi:hypothetical protein